MKNLRPALLLAPLAICCLLPSCSKSEADSITDVLEKCATKSQEAAKYTDVAAQANFISRTFQEINVTHCPADFRMAFQAHAIAWQEAVPAYSNNSAGTAFVEGFAAAVTQNPEYVGQANQQANYASQKINDTYYVLTQIAAKYGARIPRSVVGE